MKGMTKMRTKIKAFANGDHVTSFDSELLARKFAIGYTSCYSGIVELIHSSGMIGQYEGGGSSKEFMLHHNTCFANERNE
jgi:hypothetical protein